MFQIKDVLRLYKSKIKKSIVKIIKYLPISSKYLGSPRDYYTSSQEYWQIAKVKTSNEVNYIPFLPASIPQRYPPKSIYEDVHWKFYNKHFHTVNPETFVVSAANCRVFGNASTIVTHDDKLLFDVSLQFGIGGNIELVEQHLAFSYLKLPKCQQVDRTIAVLSTAGSEGYFHWLMDSLPRLEILKQSLPGGLESIDKFIINQSNLSAINESLKILDIPPNKLIYADRYTHIQARKLVVPSLPGNTGDPTAWTCEFLRGKLLKFRAEIEPIPKLYISRSRAKYRKILNEDDVLNCVSKFGFTPIYLEEYNFTTQIAILANAEFIVAPHGAGLTNLVWCNPGTKVLEIFSPNYINICFWVIANQVKLDYYYLIGEGKKHHEGYDPHLYQDNITVSIEELTQSLIMMLDRPHELV